MKKVIIKFEEEEKSDSNKLIKNELEVLQCKEIQFPNDSVFGVITDEGDIMMWPIRRIKSIKVQKTGDGK
mgnify:CR=1 FL=1